MKKDDKILLEKHKDIARIDQDIKRTHGWYVRVRFRGETHSKFFSDRKCGGRYSSLLAALAWRDKTETELGKQVLNFVKDKDHYEGQQDFPITSDVNQRGPIDLTQIDPGNPHLALLRPLLARIEQFGDKETGQGFSVDNVAIKYSDDGKDLVVVYDNGYFTLNNFEADTVDFTLYDNTAARTLSIRTNTLYTRNPDENTLARFATATGSRTMTSDQKILYNLKAAEDNYEATSRKKGIFMWICLPFSPCARKPR